MIFMVLEIILLTIFFLVYDLVTGARTSHFSTEAEITHLVHGTTSNILVAASRNGAFHVWELTNCTLEAHHLAVKPLERRPVVNMAMSRTHPMLFYAKVKTNCVYGL